MEWKGPCGRFPIALDFSKGRTGNEKFYCTMVRLGGETVLKLTKAEGLDLKPPGTAPLNKE